jgi:hypothetical protein
MIGEIKAKLFKVNQKNEIKHGLEEDKK